MAQTSSGDYYYVAGTVNEQLADFGLYEDANGAFVVHDESNDEEYKVDPGNGLDVPASRGYRVDGTQVVGGQQALTDSTGGTADGTLSAVSGSGADTAINNNFAEIYSALNSHGLVA